MHPERFLQGVPNPDRAQDSALLYALVVPQADAQAVGHLLLGQARRLARLLKGGAAPRAPRHR